MDLFAIFMDFKELYSKNFKKVDKSIDVLISGLLNSFSIENTKKYLPTIKANTVIPKLNVSSEDTLKIKKLEISKTFAQMPKAKFKEESKPLIDSHQSQESSMKNLTSPISEISFKEDNLLLNDKEDFVNIEKNTAISIPSKIRDSDLDSESLPAGSMVSSITVKSGKILEKVYLTPDGKQFKLRQTIDNPINSRS